MKRVKKSGGWLPLVSYSMLKMRYFLSIAFFMLFLWLFINAVLVPRYLVYNNSSLPIFILAIFITVASIGLYKKFQTVGAEKDRQIIIPLMIFMFLVHLILGMALVSAQGWDAKIVNDSAVNYALGNLEDVHAEYFKMYPNNLGIFLLQAIPFRIFYKLFDMTNFVILGLIINVVFMQLAVWMTFFVCRKFISRKAGYISLILSFILIVLSMHTRTIYTDTIGMFFPVTIIYLFLMGARSNKKWRGVFGASGGVLAFVGGMLKPTVYITLIAVIFCWLSRIFASKSSRKQSAVNLGIAITALSITALMFFLLKPESLKDKNMATPLTHFLSMGVTTYGTCSNSADCLYGVYSEEKNKLKEQMRITNGNTQAYAVVALKDYTQVVRGYGVGGYFDFLTKKGSQIIGDASFFAYREGYESTTLPYSDSEVSKTIQKFMFVSGAHYTKFIYLLQLFWYIILALILLPAVRYFFSKTRGRKILSLNNELAILIRTNLLGVMVFLLLFEGRSRYLVLFIPLFIILSVYELDAVACCKKHSFTKPASLVSLGFFKKYRHQVRYLISGMLAAVLEFSSFNLLFYVVLRKNSNLILVAQIFSYLIGFTTAFIMHNKFSFKTERKYAYSKKKQLVGYAMISLVSLGLTSLILIFLKNQFGVWPWLAKVITMGLQVLWNFVILNKIVFRSEPIENEKTD